MHSVCVQSRHLCMHVIAYHMAQDSCIPNERNFRYEIERLQSMMWEIPNWKLICCLLQGVSLLQLCTWWIPGVKCDSLALAGAIDTSQNIVLKDVRQ